MGKKVFKLFMETMLRAAVIILGICIIIMIALLIKTIHKNNEAAKEKDNTVGSDILTEADDPDDPTFTDDAGQSAELGEENQDAGGNAEAAGDIKNANILVINASGTSGVAGSWKSTLEGEGYTSVEVGNYLPGIITTTQVCTANGYDAADLASKFTSPEISTVSELDASSFDMTISNYDIVIVVGTNDIR